MSNTIIPGLRVLNVHREGANGTLLAVFSGCNRLYRVKFDNQEFDSIMCHQDLAEIATYPQSRGVFDNDY